MENNIPPRKYNRVYKFTEDARRKEGRYGNGRGIIRYVSVISTLFIKWREVWILEQAANKQTKRSGVDCCVTVAIQCG